jgi:outer membrane immunogenic protein
MKKLFWLASVGLLALGMAAPASAADLGAQPYVKAPPPPPPVYDWSGFYIGANGGWGSAHNCWDVTPFGGALFNDGCVSRSGGVVGGQIGYRWEWGGGWVVGLEAQGDWASLRGSRISVLDPLITEQSRLDGIGLFTGQIGYAWNASLLYFKGGAAVTSNRFSLLDTATGIGLASLDTTRWGGTVGVGYEYGFGPGWSVGVEYDHLFMGHADNTFVNGISVVDHPLFAGALNHITEDVDMVTVRFNYRFGGYGGYGGYGGAPHY